MSIARPEVNTIWGSSGAGNIESPAGLVATGWVNSAGAPSYQWMNWILNVLHRMAEYLICRGIPDWSSEETYSVGDTVRYTDGKVYECTTAPTSNQVPTNVTYWQIFGTSWLPDALKNSLASSLPPLISSAMATLLKLTWTGTVTKGTAGFGGLVQFAWDTVTMHQSGEFPGNTAITWNAPFAAIIGVLLTPKEANCTLYVDAQDTTGCTIGVQSTPTSPPNPAHVFVLGIGTPTS